MPGDHRIAVGAVLLHFELGCAVADVRVELLEGPGVQQLLHPLAGGVLPLLVLLGDCLLGPGVDDLVAQLL